MLALGDSVMLGASTALDGHGFTVDTIVSRQFIDGPTRSRRSATPGSLGDAVVLHLGTNGTIGDESMQRMMDALVDVPHVLLLHRWRRP